MLGPSKYSSGSAVISEGQDMPCIWNNRRVGLLLELRNVPVTRIVVTPFCDDAVLGLHNSIVKIRLSQRSHSHSSRRGRA